MKRDLAKLTLFGGVVLLLIQLLMSSFDYIDGSYYMTEQFAVIEKVTFLSFISFIWAAIIGTVLLTVSFLFRFTSRSPLFTELIGTALWIFQIYQIYKIVGDFGILLRSVAVGAVGIVLLLVSIIYDLFVLVKAKQNQESE